MFVLSSFVEQVTLIIKNITNYENMNYSSFVVQSKVNVKINPYLFNLKKC